MATTNHIFIDQDMQVVLVKPKAPTAKFAECIAMVLCVIACMLSAAKTLDFSSSFTIYLFAIICCVGITLICNMQKHRKKTLISILSIYLLLAYTYIDKLELAFWITNSRIIKAMNRYYNTGYGYHMPFYTYQEYVDSMLFGIMMATFFLILLFSLCIVLNKSATGTLVLLAPFIYSSLYFTKEPHAFPLMMMLLGFIFVFSMDVLHTKISGKRLNPYFVKKQKAKKTYFYFHNSAFQKSIELNYGMMIVSIVLILVMVLSIVVPRSAYEPNNGARQLIQQMVSEVSKFRFGGGVSKMSSGGVGYGVLGDVDTLRYSNEVHLKVKTNYRTPMYLKGYVGAQYYDNRWEIHSSNTIKANQELFQKFMEQNIPAQNIERIFWELCNPEELSRCTLENVVTVENIAANPTYYYSPYFLNSNSELFGSQFMKYEQDTMMKTQRKRLSSYTWNSFLFQRSGEEEKYTAFYDSTIQRLRYALLSSDYRGGDNEEYYDFLTQIEQEYDAFVKAEYTRLPDDKLQQLKAEAKLLEAQNENKTVDEKVKAVAGYLAQNTKYSLSPGKTPNGKDFAEYFLFEKKEGYCSHYATTATLMLRAMGIPARYVEGYTVTDKDYIENEATIKDTNAHAWVEVYFSSVGWVPFEVTPGFSQSTISNENNSNASYNMMSQPQPSSTVSQASSETEESQIWDEEPTDWENFIKAFWRVVTVIVCLVVALILTSLFFIIRRFLIIRKRKKPINHHDINNATLEVYRYINTLIAYIGYRAEDYQNEQAFAKYVDEHCRYTLQKGIMQKVVKIALKAQYSNHMITQEEFQTVREFSQTLAKTIYQAQSGWERIRFQFIKALY